MFTKFRQFYAAVKKDFARAYSNIKWNYKLVYDTHNLVFDFFTERFNDNLAYRHAISDGEANSVLDPCRNEIPSRGSGRLPSSIRYGSRVNFGSRVDRDPECGPIVIKNGKQVDKTLNDLLVSQFERGLPVSVTEVIETKSKPVAAVKTKKRSPVKNKRTKSKSKV